MTSLITSQQLTNLWSLQCSQLNCGTFDENLQKGLVKILGSQWADVIQRLQDQDEFHTFLDDFQSKYKVSSEDYYHLYPEIPGHLEYSENAETPENAENLGLRSAPKSIDSAIIFLDHDEFLPDEAVANETVGMDQGDVHELDNYDTTSVLVDDVTQTKATRPAKNHRYSESL